MISFSIVEDRIRSLYYLFYVRKNNSIPSENKMKEGFLLLVKKMSSEGLLDSTIEESLKSEALERNRLFHSTMWNLDGFSLEKVIRVVKLARAVDKILKKYKSMFKRRFG